MEFSAYLAPMIPLCLLIQVNLGMDLQWVSLVWLAQYRYQPQFGYLVPVLLDSQE